MFDEAVEHHQKGRFRDAEGIYREILQRDANHHPTLHFYGVLAHQCNQNLVALEMLRKAISLESNIAEYHNNCGAVYYALGKMEEAATCYRRAVELNPRFAAGQNNLGNVLRDQGRLDESEACYRRALELDPGLVAAHNNLGNIEKDRGHLDVARQLYQKALDLNPNYPEANNNLGNFLKDELKFAEAVEHYRRAIATSPHFPEAHNNLAVALRGLGCLDEALTHVRKAIELRPSYADAHNNLGLLLKDSRQYVQAIASFSRAAELEPDFFPAYNNLGITLHDLGRLPEAIECYEKAMTLETGKSFTYSNLLFTLHHHPSFTPEMMLKEHLEWGEKFGKPTLPAPEFKNSRNPDRRLRIGYVSPDFRKHVVATNMTVILKGHDHSKVEVFCYSCTPHPDQVTEGLKKLADHWRDIAPMSDEQARACILQDQIDVLIDIAGHTGESRIRLFVERCAPIQVNFLGYFNTSGVPAMDYRITDAYGDPPGMSEPYYTEKLFRLNGNSMCYQSPEIELPVVETPALKQGYVTFGSFNNLSKMTPEVMACWAQILHGVPGSRLLLKTHCLTDPEVQRMVAGIFAHHGIMRDRLEMHAFAASFKDHMELYGKIDIGLDPFPFNGGVTSFECIWMGVPFVTLEGNSFISRLGVRQMGYIGLSDWVVPTKDAYVKQAVQAAEDLPALNALRQTIRGRVQSSPLADGKATARGLEEAFREMWKKWVSKEK